MYDEGRGSGRFSVAIIACGKATRLANRLNGQPKCMLPIAGKPALMHQLAFWQEADVSKVRVVLPEWHHQLVAEALANYGYSDFVELIAHNEADGSFSAMRSLAKKLIAYEQVFVQWSDLLPMEHFSAIGRHKDCTLMLTNSGKCRFGFDATNWLSEGGHDANVQGAYFLPNAKELIALLSQLEPPKEHADFADMLVMAQELWLISLAGQQLVMLDFGDAEKLANVEAYMEQSNLQLVAAI